MIRIDTLTVTTWPTRAPAEKLAAVSRTDDPEGGYEVRERWDGRFFVVVLEDGEEVGTL